MSNRHYEYIYEPRDEQNEALISQNEKNEHNNSKYKLLSITTSTFEHDWPSIMHAHYFTEIFYVTGGMGIIYAEDKSLPIKKNDLIIINSNISHTEKSLDKNEPLSYIVIAIEGIKFKINNEETQFFSVSSFEKQKDIMLFLLDSMLTEIQGNDLYHSSYCQHLFELFIINILRYNESILAVTNTQNVSRECAIIKNYIDNNFKQDLTLDLLAEKAHINKYYLSHTFKENYGYSPINYMLEKRIEEAKHLLVTTDYTLSQLSQILGFSSLSYFSQSFKRIVKISPIEYRKRFNK